MSCWFAARHTLVYSPAPSEGASRGDCNEPRALTVRRVARHGMPKNIVIFGDRTGKDRGTACPRAADQLHLQDVSRVIPRATCRGQRG
jgi:hypothetical protein